MTLLRPSYDDHGHQGHPGVPTAAVPWLDLYRRAAGQMLSTPALDDLVRDALATIAELVDGDAVSLLLANPDSTELVLRAAFGLTLEIDDEVAIALGEGVAGKILASGAPARIEDLRTVPVKSQLLLTNDQRSYVGVPLVAGDRVLGVLHASRRVVRPFQEADVSLLTRLAEPIAAAIERVRLFEAERLARAAAEAARHDAEVVAQQLRGLQRITAALASAASAKEVCDIIIEQTVLPGTTNLQRGIWTLQDGRLLLVSGEGASAEFPEIPLDESLPAGENLRDGEPIFVESREEIVRRWPRLAHNAVSSFAGLPLVYEGRRLGVMAIGVQHDHGFAAHEREYLVTISEQAAAALARAEAHAALEAARRLAEERRSQLDFLARSSERLGRSLDLDVTMQAIAKLAVPTVADRCAVYLVDGNSIAKRVLAPELNEDERRLFESTAPSLSAPDGVGSVIRTGESLYVPEVTDELLVASAPSDERLALLRAVGFGGMAIVPLRARGRVLGALAFVNRRGRRMTTTDRTLGEQLAARAAVSVDNCLLFQRESHVARRLTESLLPTKLPTVAGLGFGVCYESGSDGLEIGGDFYDVVEVSSDEVLIVAGDVQGKGVEAAAVTGLARHTVRAVAHYETAPAAVLARLNDALLREPRARGDAAASRRLCTAVVVRLAHRAGRWTATIASGGHPLPLRRRPGGEVTEVGSSNLMLGVAREASFAETSLVLQEGDMLVLYTDGVSEGPERTRPLGSDGLQTLVAGDADDPRAVAQMLMDGALAEQTAQDDMLVLAVSVQRARRRRFSCELSAAAGARDFVRDCLGEKTPSSSHATLARLLVSELVTNAVTHARSDVDVAVDVSDGRVRVEVADADPTPPAALSVGPDSPHGRGLAILTALADDWGWVSLARGKAVWFELRDVAVDVA